MARSEPHGPAGLAADDQDPGAHVPGRAALELQATPRPADPVAAPDPTDRLASPRGQNRLRPLAAAVGNPQLSLANGLAGADTIHARDSGPDTIDCGAQIDVAITDATETAVTACETVDDPSVIAAPAITGSNPPSGSNANSPQISGTAAAGSNVSLFTAADCSGAPLVTGAAAGFASPGLTISVADNSTTTVYARASSALDSDGPSACSPGFTYAESTPAGGGDTTAPETTIAKPIKRTTDRTPKFSFTSSEAGSRFECRVDKAAFAACASPFTTKKLKRGKHTFEVRAIDAAGNADQSPAKDAFKVKKKRKRKP
jgi:hypothetical protein